MTWSRLEAKSGWAEQDTALKEYATLVLEVGALICLSKRVNTEVNQSCFAGLTNSCNSSDVNETGLVVNQLAFLAIQWHKVRVVDKVM